MRHNRGASGGLKKPTSRAFAGRLLLPESKGSEIWERGAMRNLTPTTLAVLAAVLVGLPSFAQEKAPAPPLPPPSPPYGAPITLEQAKKAADGAEAEARKRNMNMVIAIVEPSGELVYFRRMDGANTLPSRSRKRKRYRPRFSAVPAKHFWIGLLPATCRRSRCAGQFLPLAASRSWWMVRLWARSAPPEAPTMQYRKPGSTRSSSQEVISNYREQGSDHRCQQVWQ